MYGRTSRRPPASTYGEGPASAAPPPAFAPASASAGGPAVIAAAAAGAAPAVWPERRASAVQASGSSGFCWLDGRAAGVAEVPGPQWSPPGFTPK